MGLFDKLKNAWVGDDEYEDDEYDEVEDSASKYEDTEEPLVIERKESKRKTTINRGEPAMSDSSKQMQFVLVKPERFEDTPKISDYLLEGKTVVLNLETTSKEIARRIVDFLTGVSYSMNGQIKKVALGTYIIVPHNAEISGDIMDEIENSGVFY